MKVLLPIFYLPPISWFTEFLDDEHLVYLEQYENFPKQTYRNRTNILGANGPLSLIVPIHHNGKRALNEIEISYAENWQKIHWKSIKIAYQSSPYFEYYESQLEQIYATKTQSLVEFNLHALQIILKIMKAEKEFLLTKEYLKSTDKKDFRTEFSAKKESEYHMPEYYQIFADKVGFVKNLSILDLLCNLGPESITYIKNIK